MKQFIFWWTGLVGFTQQDIKDMEQDRVLKIALYFLSLVIPFILITLIARIAF